jgi:hypothetical protein
MSAAERLPLGPLRTELIQLRRINTKTTATSFAKSAGFCTVDSTEHPSIESAMKAAATPRFVIKPSVGHSSAGVFLLERLPDGALRCAMTGQTYPSEAEIIARFHRERARNGRNIRSGNVLLETYVEDSFGFEVPLDYKVYAFRTGAPIVMQRHAPRHLPKSAWAFAFYDRRGRDLGMIRNDTTTNPAIHLKPPENLDDLFAVAQSLVKAAGVSFMRVDLYSTPRDIVFGEFTPVPNLAKESFNSGYEEVLFRHWRDSLEELGISYD